MSDYNGKLIITVPYLDDNPVYHIRIHTKKTIERLLNVNNFETPDMPILIRLKAGNGRRIKKDMDEFVEYLLKHIPEIFESDAYQERRKEKIDSFKEIQKKLIKGFEEEIAKENFTLIRCLSHASC